MIDFEFARSCADSIRARHGTMAEEFVRGKIREVEESGPLSAVMMWRAIAQLVAPRAAGSMLG